MIGLALGAAAFLLPPPARRWCLVVAGVFLTIGPVQMWRAFQEELDAKKSHWDSDEGEGALYQKMHMIGLISLGCLVLLGNLFGC